MPEIAKPHVSRIFLLVVSVCTWMLMLPAGNVAGPGTPAAAAQESAISAADQEKVLKFLKKQFANPAYRIERGQDAVRVFAGTERIGDLTKTPSGDFRITGKLSSDAKTRPSLVQERNALETRLRALLGNPAVTLKGNDSSGLLELKDEGIGFLGVRSAAPASPEFFYELRLIVLKPDLEE